MHPGDRLRLCHGATAWLSSARWAASGSCCTETGCRRAPSSYHRVQSSEALLQRFRALGDRAGVRRRRRGLVWDAARRRRAGGQRPAHGRSPLQARRYTNRGGLRGAGRPAVRLTQWSEAPSLRGALRGCGPTGRGRRGSAGSGGSERGRSPPAAWRSRAPHGRRGWRSTSAGSGTPSTHCAG